MNLKNLIKQQFGSLFNRKNYKMIIIILLAIALLFLLSGNYNLKFKEGYGTLDAELQDLYAKTNTISAGAKQSQNTATKYTNAAKNKDFEGFTESMFNCSNIEHSSDLGGDGNLLMNSTCEQYNNLDYKNKQKTNKKQIKNK